ncbi:MAG TPA: hypothetical protein VGH10_06770, partial [Actinomycetota bacterium]
MSHPMTSLGIARRMRFAVGACVTALALLGGAGPAKAQFGLEGPFVATLKDTSGNPQTQAGSHPDAFTTTFNLHEVPGPDPSGSGGLIPVPDEKIKDVIVELPPGLAGSANGAAVCSVEQFGNIEQCPAESVVGVAELNLGLFGAPNPMKFAVFNLEPGPNQAARFGWRVLIPPVNVVTTVRSESDYGLTSSIADTNQAAALYGSVLTLWGVPADHNLTSDVGSPDFGMPGHGPRRWLLRMPTACNGDLTVKLKINSYEHPADVKEYTATLPGPTGCDAVPFNPSISVEPTTRQADAPSGYDIHIKLPQSEDPAQLGTADLKDATVTLPEGVSISPSAANGLQACTD